MERPWESKPRQLARDSVRQRATASIVGVVFLAACGGLGVAVTTGGSVIGGLLGIAMGSAVGLVALYAWSLLAARGVQLRSAVDEIQRLQHELDAVTQDRALNVHVSVREVAAGIGGGALVARLEQCYVVNRSRTRPLNLTFRLEAGVERLGPGRVLLEGLDPIYMKQRGWTPRGQEVANPKHVGPGDNAKGGVALVYELPNPAGIDGGEVTLEDPTLLVYDAQSQETVRLQVPGSYDSPDPPASFP